MNAIIGAGEIANAISKHLISDFKMWDKGEYEDKEESAEIVHICIPFTDEESFLNVVLFAIKAFDPTIVINHATCPPGTTEKIEHDMVLYSPVNGRHGDGFEKNITLYNKLFAGDPAAFQVIESEFSLACHFWGENMGELEFSKIMCTSYMYWNLVYQKTVAKVCKQRGYDFDKVYTDWNVNYNRGIKVLHSYWERPIYDLSESPVPGGHCLKENTKLDRNFVLDILSDYTKSNGNLRYTNHTGEL